MEVRGGDRLDGTGDVVPVSTDPDHPEPVVAGLNAITSSGCPKHVWFVGRYWQQQGSRHVSISATWDSRSPSQSGRDADRCLHESGGPWGSIMSGGTTLAEVGVVLFVRCRRPGRRRRVTGRMSRPMLVVVLLAIAVVQHPALADCATPYLTADDSGLQVGDPLIVQGEHFAAECNDTGIGCMGPRRSPPSRGIDLELRHEGQIVASTVVDAEDDFAFTVEFTVPEDAPSGMYRVVAVEDRPHRQEWESAPFVIEAP